MVVSDCLKLDTKNHIEASRSTSLVLEVLDLGLVDYSESYLLQKNLVEKIKNHNQADVIIFCQHHPVITLGRQAKRENILLDKTALKVQEIGVEEVDRGGDVTLHNPGQLMIYPIFDLHRFKMDLGWFLERLEDVIIESLHDLYIEARSIPGLRGVWFKDCKIASIGIGVKHWITFHGVSLNICNDLSQFSLIKPCGLDIEMTSVEKATNRKFSIVEIQKLILGNFINVFNFKEARYARSSIA